MSVTGGSTLNVSTYSGVSLGYHPLLGEGTGILLVDGMGSKFVSTGPNSGILTNNDSGDHWGITISNGGSINLGGQLNIGANSVGTLTFGYGGGTISANSFLGLTTANVSGTGGTLTGHGASFAGGSTTIFNNPSSASVTTPYLGNTLAINLCNPITAGALDVAGTGTTVQITNGVRAYASPITLSTGTTTAASSNALTVDGSGTRLLAPSGQINIGANALANSATLTVSNGAMVSVINPTSGGLYIGASGTGTATANGTGTVNVTGAGSILRTYVPYTVGGTGGTGIVKSVTAQPRQRRHRRRQWLRRLGHDQRRWHRFAMGRPGQLHPRRQRRRRGHVEHFQRRLVQRLANYCQRGRLGQPQRRDAHIVGRDVRRRK